MPEYKKMRWQAIYFLISIALFMTQRFLPLVGVYEDYISLIFFNITTQFAVDFMPIAYVMFCH